MESTSSGEAMKRDEATYGQRRKHQNRLAQRRFRKCIPIALLLSY
jgi:hypothetical protein